MPSDNRSDASLSVAMIVRNAEDLLCQSLDSVRAIADEIVVLDTGSTDGTVDSARAAGAEVHVSPWQDDFAAARNECLTHVRGNWVLWVDAGETIDDVAALQLREFVRGQADREKAYLVFVQLAANTPQLSGEQIGQLRLLPVRDDLRFTGRIRERILPSVVAAGLDVDALSFHIHRPVDDYALARKQDKARRNLRIAALAEEEDGESATLCMVRAEAHQVLGMCEQAERLYRRTIELAERASSEMLEAYYGLLTSFDGRPDHSEVQIGTCLEALDIFPLDAQLLCGMGSYLIKQGRLDLAARSYELAATHGQVDPATWHLADIGEVAVSCLALTHQLQNRLPEARQALEAALAERPSSMRLRRQLIELLIKCGDRVATLAQFDRLPRDLPGREALRSAIRGALLANEKNWLAAEPYLKTAFTAGCRDSLCLRWLMVSYLALDRVAQAEEILRAWRATEPESGELATYERALAERKQSTAAGGDSTVSPTSPRSQAAGRTISSRPERRVRIDPANVPILRESPGTIPLPTVHPGILPEPPAPV